MDEPRGLRRDRPGPGLALRIGWALAGGLVLLGMLTACQRSELPVEAQRPPAAPSGSSAERSLRFSGYEWIVKSAAEGKVGPGPNHFADGSDAVWVDDAGRLHLRIRFKYGRWWAAEVISVRSFGYGTYRFHLDGNLDELDPNAILGLFTWSDDPAFAHREIDIELARWGQSTNDLGQCVVQPYTHPGNIARFAYPAGVSGSLHSFTWAPGRVSCQIAAEPDPKRERGAVTIFEHDFSANVPEPGGENARINLWLLGGQAPRHGQDVEVVIKRFEFKPS